MKNKIILIFTLIIFQVSWGQESKAFKSGEFLKYRIHYGFINAGYATLGVQNQYLNNKSHYAVTGRGWTVGAAKMFFKVEDLYKTYIDKKTMQPSKFVRKINEGGYTKNKVLNFDIPKRKVKVNDKKNKTTKTYLTPKDVQDMLSSFYYMRNFDSSKLKTGDKINMNIFMDEEIYKFKLLILGRETKKTKFGKVKTLKLRPVVQSGRVFKAKESVTLWVTDDSNHLPVQMKAKLAVGSLKADLENYKNLKKPLKFL